MADYSRLHDIIASTTRDLLRSSGMDTERTSQLGSIIDALAAGVARAISEQTAPIITALQTLGDQVANHNEILRSLDSAAPAERPVWHCYCGTYNGGPVCYVCNRKAP